MLESTSARNRSILALAALITALAVFLAFPTPAGDTDMWWHMAYGEQVLERGTWHQDHDEWAWTDTVDEWIYVTWLSDVILFVAYDRFGGLGLSLLQAMIGVLVAAMFLDTIRTSGRRVVPLDLFVLGVTLISLRTVAANVKPEMFSILYFAVVAWIWTDARQRGKDRFWLLPVVFLLWVNSHGAVLMGLLLLAALVTGETIARRFGNGLNDRSYRRLLIFTGVALLAAGINPHGHRLIVHPFLMMVGSGLQDEAARVQAFIPRWSHLVPGSFTDGYRSFSAWTILGFFVVTCFASVRSWLRRRSIEPALLIGALGFFAMGMQIARAGLFLPLFFLMTSSVLLRARDDDGAEVRPNLRWRSPQMAALGLLLLVAAGLHATAIKPYRWARGADPTVVPIEETRYVREHELPGPLFNDYVSGGWLIWDLVPEYEVFIDPRYRPYEKKLLDNYFLLLNNLSPTNVEGLAERYGFRTAFVSHVGVSKMARAFQESTDWTLVFLGPVAAVFVHKDDVTPELAAGIPANTDIRRLVEYGDAVSLASAAEVRLATEPNLVVELNHLLETEISPWQLRRSILIEQLEGKIHDIVWKAPDGSERRSEDVAAQFFDSYRAQDLHSARFLAAAITARIPDDSSMWFNRACVESRLGSLEIAARSLDRALELGYDQIDLIRNDPDLDALRSSDLFPDVLDRHDVARR